MTTETVQQQATTDTPDPKTVQGTPEYNAEMARRAENPEQYRQEAESARNGKTVPAMPEGGSDKFYNKDTGAYDWQAHAKELQWKIDNKGQPKDDKSANDKQQTPDDKKDGQQAEAKSAVEQAGLNFDTLTQKVVSTGNIEQADYDALAKIGIPKAVVDGYIKSITIAQEQSQQAAYTYVGQELGADPEQGKQALSDSLSWASSNLEKAEIDSINKTLASADWKNGVNTLMQKFLATRKSAGEPAIITGDNTQGSSDMAPFRSQSEMVAAMGKRNERGLRLYDVDPAYRDRVRQRVAMMR